MVHTVFIEQADEEHSEVDGAAHFHSQISDPKTSLQGDVLSLLVFRSLGVNSAVSEVPYHKAL